MREKICIQANAMKQMNDFSMKGEIVFFGSTYMSGFPLYEFVNRCNFENAIYNRSIEELTVGEAREIVDDCVINIAPDKIFLSLGEADEDKDKAVEQYVRLVSGIRSRLPRCELYLIGLSGDSEYVKDFNREIAALCDNDKVRYIELISAKVSDRELYKARFKQLSRFFRIVPLNMPEAFAMAEL